MKKLEFVIAVTLSTLLLQPVKAAAPDTKQRKFCQNYASTAKDAADRNRSQRCYFKGRRWGTDPNRHFAWCMTGPARLALSKEAFARRQGLHECRERRRLCKTHARVAVWATQTAWERDQPKLLARSGLSKIKNNKPFCRDKSTSIIGKQMYSIWNRKSTYRHWDWCMAVGLGQARRIEALRAKRLEKC